MSRHRRDTGGVTEVIADLSPQQIRALEHVGFWWSEEQPHLPHPRDFVDAPWREAEGDRVLEYIRAAYGLPYTCTGPSWCRLGCSGVPPDIGTQDRTDGSYLFPEGLAHYIAVHCVRPGEAFLAHIRRNNYCVPRLPILNDPCHD